MDLIGLVCAVLASLASGVLIAYAVCVGFFRLFGLQRPTPSKSLAAVAPAVPIKV